MTTELTCKFCSSAPGDEAPSVARLLNVLNYEPEFFGDSDYERCDECGRWVCMACAIFSFGDNEAGYAMRYLCPDCGQPTDIVMMQIGAPMLPFPVENCQPF